jgi:hypothetical protein
MCRFPTLLVLVLLHGCAQMQAHAGEARAPASIAVWTVPKEVTAGKEFWLQTRIVPNATLPAARLSLEASPADFRIVGPSTLDLGTIMPPKPPPASKPPALPFSYVNAFRLVALHAGTFQLGVRLTSGGGNMSLNERIEVAPGSRE